jgi:chemotaxis protein CheX
MNMTREEIVGFVAAATEEVFSTMLGLETQAGEPYVERSSPGPSEGVIALIGMTGEWIGTGCFSGSAAIACKLASRLLMMDTEPVDKAVNEEVLDAWAEITNMIIGNVKTALEERLGPMGLSIPTVIYGRNFSTRSIGSEEWTVVPFSCFVDEHVEVRVCLAPARTPNVIRHGFTQTREVGV